MTAFICIDFETTSPVDIRNVTTHRYAAEADVLLTAIAILDPDNQLRSFIYEGFPHELLSKAINNDEVHLIAHNAAFERRILQRVGYDTKPEKWIDTAAWSRYLGGPGALSQALDWWNVGASKGDGGAGIRRFSLDRANPADYPEEWEAFKEYAEQDALTEMLLWIQLGAPDSMPDDWYADMTVNDKGIQVDKPFVKALAQQSLHQFTALRQDFVAKYGFPPKSPIKCKEWLNSNLPGEFEPVVNMNAKELAGIDFSETSPEVQQFLAERDEVVGSAWAKYQKMLDSLNDADRINDTFLYRGATRTGRWSSQIIQLHNLPRDVPSDAEVQKQRSEVLTGSDIPPAMYRKLIRSTLIPAKGKVFVVADFAQVEARITAWLANETAALKLARENRLYEGTAERMFMLPPGSVTKDSPERQAGKAGTLALGFGGGAGALAYAGGMKGDEDELKNIVALWRNANTNIVNLWYDYWAAFTSVAFHGLHHQFAQDVTFDSTQYIPKALADRSSIKYLDTTSRGCSIKLPSGRRLYYRGVHTGDSDDGTDKQTYYCHTPQGRRKLWHGVIMENIAQATAADLLADLLVKWRGAVVAHTHDEIILEVPVGLAEKTADVLTRYQPPAWADGLPLSLSVDIKTRYGK